MPRVDERAHRRGIETRDEYQALRAMGIELFQGYYFARPQFATLAEIPSRCFEGSVRLARHRYSPGALEYVVQGGCLSIGAQVD